MTPIPTGRRAFVRVVVEVPTGISSDGEGGYTDAWTDSPPAWDVAIDVTGGGTQEQRSGQTVLTQATLNVTGPYRSDVTTAARLRRSDGRHLAIVGVVEPDGRPFELQCACIETT